MNPIHTTTEDCKNPFCDKGVITNGHKCECCNKGKTTKLIFDAKEFECDCDEGYEWREPIYSKTYKEVRIKCQKCKGTGYILPKKGDVQRVDSCKCKGKEFHAMMCSNPFKKFHLTKDAEVKMVKECFDILQPIGYFAFKKEHNLKEDSKIVICEGYYE